MCSAFSRALVLTDEESESEAHSWWTCTTVCGAFKRPPPIVASDFTQAEQALSSALGAVLLTTQQAEQLGVSVQDDPTVNGDEERQATLFSREFIYTLAALKDLTDRVFRKACQRAQAALRDRELQVRSVVGAEITEALVGSCMCCRNIWLKRRAADRRAAAARAGQRYNGPPWAGISTSPIHLAALKAKRTLPTGAANTDLALSYLGTADGAVVAYAISERVGRTIVAVDGVHDYSVADADARADPSALLLHTIASWWLQGKESARPLPSPASPAPIWLNDGPIPTPGLLKYKSQYRRSGGRVLHVLSLPPSRSGAARARWSLLMDAWRKSRRVHVGALAIELAARRMYATAGQS
jgi:hypothetical protein